MLKSNLFHYSDAYMLVKGDVTIIAAPATQVSFKNCTPFTKCIKKIDTTTVDVAEDLDLVIPMYNFIDYSSNYSETIGIFGFILKMKQLILVLILKTLMNLSYIRLDF